MYNLIWISAALNVLLVIGCVYWRSDRNDWHAKFNEEHRLRLQQIAEMNQNRA